MLRHQTEQAGERTQPVLEKHRQQRAAGNSVDQIAARLKARAEQRTQHTPVTTVTPRCLDCGRSLRRYRYRNESWAGGRAWGDYGDGYFCGLRCGYRFAVQLVKKEREQQKLSQQHPLAGREPSAT